MPTLASDIMAGAAALLNDVNQRKFTNAALLPYMKMAYRDLEDHLDVNGVRTLYEVSADIPVAASSTTLTLPSDFVSPVDLWERAPDSAENWQPMEERRWEPSDAAGLVIGYWTFREEAIQLKPATAAREVRLRYKKSLTPITSVSSAIGVRGSENYLERRVAALAARYMGENPSRASSLDSEAEIAKLRLVNKGVKSQQGRSVRRRRYGSSWRSANQ